LPRDVGLFVAGIISTLILLVLDKAGKLQGPALYGLLAVACLLTLPLVTKNKYISTLSKPWNILGSIAAAALACSVYVVIGVWISPLSAKPTIEPAAQSQAPESPSTGTTTTKPSQEKPPEKTGAKKEKKIPVSEKRTPPAPDQAPPATVNNNAPGGIIVSGGTVTNPTVNNFGPPPVQFVPALNEVVSDRDGLRRTEITLVPSAAVPAPFVIVLEFDNPVSNIYGHVLNVAAQMGGGPYRIGTHAFVTIGTGINPTHPLMVTVYSVLPVKLVGAPAVQ
jgi:hypothetical protein